MFAQSSSRRHWSTLPLLIIATSCLTACGQVPHVPQAQALTTTTTAVTTHSPAARAPAVAQQPNAPICADVNAEGTTVSLIVNPDTPIPRCQRVIAEQRLTIINNTSATIEVKLAQFDVQIAPGARHTLDAAFGTYLATGVHRVSLSSYPGSGGAEVWLVDKP